MRFGGLAQAMNLIKLISSLSKHHSDPPCPIIHCNGIITVRCMGPDRQHCDTGPQTLGYASTTMWPVHFKHRLIMVNGMVHICHSW